MKETIVTCIAIAAVVFLLREALLQGINGVLLSTGIAAISGLGGYKVKVARDKQQAKGK